MADSAVENLRNAKTSIRYLSCEPLLNVIRLKSADLNWVIIGAQTGPGSKQPANQWVENLTKDARNLKAAVFYKPNLVWHKPPREFPI